MFRAYVLIIRKSKLHYTDYGTIIHIVGSLEHSLMMMSTCARNMWMHEINLLKTKILCLNLVNY